ncbi:hypothetical protein N865_19560 [Intrasporangium oryzae NRRL B-24470]|uniref:Uncharacterized protein n=1 Tax=Intrasporangium oryzae NRRL B-24470 TaxID=1386089 RepID=W9G1I2_9MICO|nr:hypothetical protein [Intrasporangium oryzae]EWS99950.1 hypothetical protein N865_19560 [Intrasporangium oryzae NRRL B-24470]
MRAEATPPSTATTEVDDEELIGQADWVIGGDAARKGRRQAWYAGYVAVLAAIAYGFPIVQAAFRTSDPAWLRAQLSSPVALGALVLAVGAALWGVYSAGGFRGPVVPPLPWIDHVVTTPVDRALSVRRWWRLSLGGSIFGGALLGATLGAGFAFAGVAPWYAAGLAVLAGAVLGRLAAALWLWGQVRSWPGRDRGPRLLVRPRRALRALHADSLRTHSANTSTIGGSVLAGNLRTARLQLARPVRHARHARLRAGGPVAVVIRRDLLGLRRVPGNLWTGVVFTVIGTAVIVWAITHSAAPVLAASLGLVPAYLGFGAWAEGLRLQADNVGTPSLLGTTVRSEGLAHLVVPTGLTLGAFGVGLVVAATTGSVPVSAGLTVLALVALLAGAHLVAAFRGTPPSMSLRPDSGPMMLVLWYLMPSLLVLVVGTLATWGLRRSPEGILWVAALVAAVVAFGLSRMERLSIEHRV